MAETVTNTPENTVDSSQPEMTFEKLEEAMRKINPDANIELLRKAYDFSKKMHEGQFRDEGTPYFVHPFRVAMYLLEVVQMQNEKMIAAALLHDVLEDAENLTYKEMEAEFGVDVAAAVNMLTKPKVTPRRSKTMRDIVYFDRLRQAPKNVILIKLADRLDNVRYLHLCSDAGKRKKYATETKEVFIPLSKKHYPQAAKEMEEILKKMSSSKISG